MQSSFKGLEKPVKDSGKSDYVDNNFYETLYASRAIPSKSLISRKTVVTQANSYNAGSNIGAKMCQIDESRFAMVHWGNGYIRAIIGSITSGAVTFGGEYQVTACASITYTGICLLDSTHLVVAYGAGATLAGTKVLTFSGTTISTAGTESGINGGTNVNSISVIAMDSTTVVYNFHNTTNNYPTGVVGTISGTNITINSNYTLSSTAITAGLYYSCDIVKYNNNTFIAAFSLAGGSYVVAGTISGTTISVGSVQPSGSAGSRSNVWVEPDGRIGFKVMSDATTPAITFCTVSGTTITLVKSHYLPSFIAGTEYINNGWNIVVGKAKNVYWMLILYKYGKLACLLEFSFNLLGELTVLSETHLGFTTSSPDLAYDLLCFPSYNNEFVVVYQPGNVSSDVNNYLYATSSCKQVVPKFYTENPLNNVCGYALSEAKAANQPVLCKMWG